MKNVRTGAYIRNDKIYDFSFGTDLSVADKARFTNFVVNFVVDDEAYNSVIKDLIFDFYLIKFFTDIDTTELEKSSDFFDDVEQFLEETNAVDIIKANMEIGLFDELNKSVDLAIEYRTGIHPNPLNEALANLVAALEKNIDKVDMNSAMGMMQKIDGMGKDFTLENLVNAYMNSDIHKEYLEEIAEEK